MPDERTTVVVQRCLDALAGEAPAEPIIRHLLDGSVRRLHHLCAGLLYRSYPRLTRPPLNLHTDELLGAVVERLLKALREGLVPAPASTGSGLSPEGRRLLDAIDGLPEDEREAFDLVRIQGLTHGEAAEVLGVVAKTVQRRLDRGLRLLTERLGDLRPGDTPPGPP